MESLIDGAIELLLELALLALIFSVLEYAFRGIKAPTWFRRSDLKTDITYYIMNSTVAKKLSWLAIIAGVALITLANGQAAGDIRSILRGIFLGDVSLLAWSVSYDMISAWPLWLQISVGLLVADFFSYWGHRFFHKKPLWYLHAIHHSPEHLDWLSSARTHPVNDLVMTVVKVLPLLLLGFNPLVFAIVTPIVAVWSVFTHANVTWDLGVLRYIIVTPRFHRWHHTSEEAGLDKNFAGLFPIYDLVFGTWYMPEQVPTRFGAGQTPVPDGFSQQLLYPFFRKRFAKRLPNH